MKLIRLPILFLALLYTLFAVLLPAAWIADLTDKTAGVIALSITLVAMLVLSKLNSETKTNILLTWFSVFFALFLVNIFLIFSFPLDTSDNRQRAAEKLGVKFDSRSPSKVLADLRADGIEATSRPVSFVGFEGRSLFAEFEGTTLAPIGGISNRITVLCNESGEYSISALTHSATPS